MVNIGSSLFLLLAPDSKEALSVLEFITNNKDKITDENVNKEVNLKMIIDNKELLVSYFVQSLKISERESIIRYLNKYKDKYDKDSYDSAIKNLLNYKYNTVIRTAIKSYVKKMIKQWKDKLIMEMNDNPELNNEETNDFIQLIEGLYE